MCARHACAGKLGPHAHRRPQAPGRVVHPGDPDWDAARGTFNVLIDQQPEAIAFPTDEREVVAVVAYARERGLRVAAQATGHNAAPLGSLEGTLILNTSALTGVSIDAAARRVRVGAATRWERRRRRSCPSSGWRRCTAPRRTSGIVGYSLGGGIGWLARKHGMQTNAVTAIELVTADGRLVRTDAEHEPELFWALRGGGGNFGVVTAIEFAVAARARALRGRAVLPRRADRRGPAHVDRAPADGLPEEITSWASVIHFPPLPEVPEAIRGRVVRDRQGGVPGLRGREGASCCGRSARSARRWTRSRCRRRPRSPSWRWTRATRCRTACAHALVDELPAVAIDEIARIAGPGSALTMLQLRHMGGALARHAPGAGARATLPGRDLRDGPRRRARSGRGASGHAQLDARLGGARAVRAPATTRTSSRSRRTRARFFDAETWERLRRVKALYDPRDVFKGNHHIPVPHQGAPDARRPAVRARGRRQRARRVRDARRQRQRRPRRRSRGDQHRLRAVRHRRHGGHQRRHRVAAGVGRPVRPDLGHHGGVRRGRLRHAVARRPQRPRGGRSVLPGGVFAYGEAGDDQLIGAPVVSGLDGGPGNDKLTGGEGHDALHGGGRQRRAVGAGRLRRALRTGGRRPAVRGLAQSARARRRRRRPRCGPDRAGLERPHRLAGQPHAGRRRRRRPAR